MENNDDIGSVLHVMLYVCFYRTYLANNQEGKANHYLDLVKKLAADIENKDLVERSLVKMIDKNLNVL